MCPPGRDIYSLSITVWEGLALRMAETFSHSHWPSAKPQARGNLLFDFPKNLQEIATSALWGLLAMTFTIVGNAVPSVPSENSGSMHEFSAGYAASRTDR